MRIINVSHITRYRYARPVAFGEHRMMFRPREGAYLRILQTSLKIEPAPVRTWFLQDMFGNHIGAARFEGRSRTLRFENRFTVEQHPDEAAPDADETFPGPALRFVYPEEEAADLARSIACPELSSEVLRWADHFRPANHPGLVLETLTSLSQAIAEDFAYERRLYDSARPAAETLALRSGSCRDFAVLMIDACRGLGLAARFASGYLATERGLGGGHTHAWVQVFLPSCGWIDFDPTNGFVGREHLIAVAVTVEASQATPLHGSWFGRPGDFLSMDVQVDITSETKPGRSLSLAAAG